jgi:hypothetical protein
MFYLKEELMIKYYTPIAEIYNFLGKFINKDMKVLELGPGVLPFPYATHFCGWLDSEREKLSNYKVVDFSKDRFPYEDKEFDFIYARHVLEDLYNPFNCIEEMSRIAKAGFIECPSPLTEVCRESENWKDENYEFKWRGYNHHHYFVWNDGQLNFLHKFPSVEYMKINQEDYLLELLKDKYYWNTYYLWKDNIKYKHHEHPKDYFAPCDKEYAELIVKGINSSINFTGNFKKKMLKIESERS